MNILIFNLFYWLINKEIILNYYVMVEIFDFFYILKGIMIIIYEKFIFICNYCCFKFYGFDYKLDGVKIFFLIRFRLVILFSF